MTINHKIHEQVHTMFYLSYTQQTCSTTLVCTSYVFARIFYLNWSKKKCYHKSNHAWSFWKFLSSQKNINLHSWTENWNFSVWSSRNDCQKMVWSQSAAVNSILIYRLWWIVYCLRITLTVTWQFWNYGRLCSPVRMSKTLQENTTFLVHLGNLLEAAGYGGILTAAVRSRYLRHYCEEIFRLRAQSPKLSTAFRRLLPWASSQQSSLRCGSSISSCFPYEMCSLQRSSSYYRCCLRRAAASCT